jgi:hypothetical protein
MKPKTPHGKHTGWRSKTFVLCSLFFVLCFSCDDPTRETNNNNNDPVVPLSASVQAVSFGAQFSTGDWDSVNGAAFGGGKFIAASGPSGHPTIGISSNGIDGWAKQDISAGLFSSYAGKLTFLNGAFLITRGKDLGRGIFSNDGGESWTATEIGFGSKGFAFGNGVYVVGGQHGQAAWARNIAGPWTTLEMAATTFSNGSSSQLYINAAAYGNGTFVMAGGRGHTAYSTDSGASWTGVLITEIIFDGPSGFIDCMAFGGGKFIALGGMDGNPAKSAYSEDGITWRQGGDPHLKANNGSPCIEYGGGYFLAADSDGNASCSVDGITWKPLSGTTFNGTPIKDIAFGNGKFLLVGGEGKAAEVIISNE